MRHPISYWTPHTWNLPSLYKCTETVGQYDQSFHILQTLNSYHDNGAHFPWLKFLHNFKNKQIVTKIQSVPEVVRIHQHAKFQTIPLMRSSESIRTRPIKSKRSQNEENDWPGLKSNQFRRFSGYTSRPNFRPLLRRVLKKMPGNFSGQTDGSVIWAMDGRTDRRKEGRTLWKHKVGGIKGLQRRK